jgi:hypothetical protein
MNQKEVMTTIYSDSNSRTILKTDSVVDELIDKFVERASMGKNKYGTTLDRNDLPADAWIDHAIEESMDFTLYLLKLKRVLTSKK